MFKLLIVDDEPIIADGLYTFFSEVSELELDLYKAYSSSAALEIMKNNEINIVISDICMPGMPGLDMLKIIKAEWPKCKFIFLTGYNDFDYAQFAIKNGVNNYILKTEGDEVILEAVKAAITEIEEEDKNKKMINKVMEEFSKALPILQSNFLKDLVDGITRITPEVEEQFKELEIKLDYNKPVLMIYGRLDNISIDMNIRDKMLIVCGIRSIAEEYFSKSFNTSTIIYERTKIICLIQPNKLFIDFNEHEQVYKAISLYLESAIESIQEAVRRVLNVSTSYIIGTEYTNWENISEKFNSLKLILNKASGFNKETILLDKSIYEKKVENDNSISFELNRIKLLETYLESGQEKEFFSELSDLIEKLRSLENLPENIRKEIYYSFAIVFLSYINRFNIEKDIESKQNLTILMNMEQFASWEEFFSYINNLAYCIFENNKKEYYINNNRIVGFINNYIEKHLGEELSLTKFADLLHFNQSYLSRLYKNQTGASITEYISKLKVTKAREMLRQDNLKINEIALSLGFETPSYFTRFFKKNTNLSPQDYRDSIGRMVR